MKSIKPTIDQNKQPAAPQFTFLRQLDFMIAKNTQFYDALLASNNLETSAKMYCRNSTKKLPIENNTVDLIVTSPPYVTSYEYADLHQLTLLWFAEDSHNFKSWKRLTTDFESFKGTFVGTLLRKKHKSNINSYKGRQIFESLLVKDKTSAVDVADYFIDMEKAFREMHRILKPDSNACIIVGNTKLHGVEILNAEVAVEQMTSVGFSKVDIIKREITNKMITPWRDSDSGKFTNMANENKTRVYESEYVIIMRNN